MEHVLARCNGTEIVDHDGELWIVEKPAPPHTATAVLLTLAFIAFVNGLAQTVLAISRRDVTNAIAAAITVLLGTVFVLVLNAVRRGAAVRSAEEPGPSMIIAGGKLLDARRRELANLTDVRLDRVFLVFARSRALAVVWPQGKRIIARGHAFGDTIDGCEHVLRSHGINKPRQRAS